jgi:hypothetical protein
MRARADQSLIGPYRIDPKGDPDPAPVSVSRLDRPGRSTVVLSDDGATQLPPLSLPRALWAGAGG